MRDMKVDIMTFGDSLPFRSGTMPQKCTYMSRYNLVPSYKEIIFKEKQSTLLLISAYTDLASFTQFRATLILSKCLWPPR
jgi:hypothetical protein